jgi:hypothetical protein
MDDICMVIEYIWISVRVNPSPAHAVASYLGQFHVISGHVTIIQFEAFHNYPRIFCWIERDFCLTGGVSRAPMRIRPEALASSETMRLCNAGRAEPSGRRMGASVIPLKDLEVLGSTFSTTCYDEGPFVTPLGYKV